MRKIMRKLHLWLSVPLGLIISIICFTGALLVFEEEITASVQKRIYHVDKIGNQRIPTGQLVEIVASTLPADVSVTGIQHPSDPSKCSRVMLSKPKRASVFIDPYTGEIKGKSERLPFFRTVFRLHRWLLDSQTDGKIFWGKTIVGISTLLFMLSLLTGIFIWWPRNRKALGKSLCIKTRKGTRTFLYSLHVAGGMYAVLLLLAMGLTGLTWSFPWYRTAFYQLFGASATSQPNNQTDKKQRAKLDTAHWEVVYQELWMRQPNCSHISIYNGYATITKKAWGNQRASDRYDFRPDNGEITQYTPYESTSRNSKLRGWIYSLHVGNWGGWFSKILTFLAALFGASLPLTGYYLWIKRLARN